MIVFDAELLKIIYAHAIREYPAECCGILIGTNDDGGCRTVKAVYKAHNSVEKKMRGRHFVISPQELLQAESEAEKNGYEMIGFYHSHTDCEAIASQEDCKYAVPDMSYPIVSVIGGQIAGMTGWEKTKDNNYEALKQEMIEIRK